MINKNWKRTFLHSLVFVALGLIALGVLGAFLAITYDDRSMENVFMPFITFVFWPGTLLPNWETKGFLVPFVGFITTLFLYSGIATIFVEGIKSIRRK